MKNLILLSTMSMAIATIAMPSLAQGQQARFRDIAPRISSTSGYSDAHTIRVYTGNQPLSFITVRPPDFISVGDWVQITDQNGEKIDVSLTREADRIRINFAQTVQPQTTLQITFTDLAFAPEVATSGIYLYDVAGGYPGFRQEIPLGLARVQVF
jgi:hypothetical protein